MIPYLDPLIDAVARHPYLAYAAVLLFALGESLPVAGALVPGSVAIIAMGALVPMGAVELWPLLAGATLGALLADWFSFWLGRRYHRDILGYWPFRHHPGLIAQGEGFFKAHGGKSVFLARFTPGVRGIVPLVAGVLHMPVPRFLAVNGLAALAWAPLHVLLGVVLGGSFVVAGAVAARLALFLVVLLAALWLIGWLVRLVFRRGLPRLARGIERAWVWALGRDSWLSREVLALLDPAQKEIRALLPLALLLVAGAWAFFALAEEVANGNPLAGLDAAIFNFLQDLRTSWADEAMVRLTELGDGAVTVPLSLVVFLWFAAQRAWRAAAYWASAVAVAALFTAAMKLGFHVPRPSGIYGQWSVFGFPSGHATVNTTIYGFLAVVAANELRPRWGGPVVVGAALIVVGMAFSRLYLGAHWFSDVAAGLAFGLAWVALLGIAYLRHRPKPVHAGGLLAAVLLTLAAAGGLHVSRQAPADLARFAVRHEVREIAEADWQAGAWRELPAFRSDLAGELREPLALIWVGELSRLEEKLGRDGWRESARWTVRGWLMWIVPAPDPLDLPVLPRLHAGRAPAATLVRADAEGRRLVLWLWHADVEIVADGGRRPVFLGVAATQELSRAAGLLTLTLERPDRNRPRDALARSLPGAAAVVRSEPADGWDGRALLAGEAGVPPAAP